MRDLLTDPVARILWVVTLLLRLAFAAEVTANELDLSNNDQLDMIFLHRNAARIADGDVLLRAPFLGHYEDIRNKIYGPERYDRLYGPATYVDSPGYLYFAAACEKIGRRSPYAVVWAQLVLDALGCALVYVLARRIYGLATARVALVAAALCLECVAEAGFVLRESVIAFLVTATTLALHGARSRGTARAWAIAGLVFGLGWITKLSFSLVLPAIPFLAWGPRPRVAARLGSFAAGALVAVAPFAARNVALGVPPLRMSATSLQIVVQRNMAGYAGVAEHMDQPAIRKILDASDDTLAGAWLGAVRSHAPGGYATQLGYKFFYFWSSIDFWNNIRCGHLRLLSPILALCVCSWGVLCSWTAVGIILAVAGSKRTAAFPLVAMFLALGLGAALVGGVYTRYRMVVEPLACVLFAATIVEAATRVVTFARRRRRSGLVISMAIVIVAVGLRFVLRDPQKPLDRLALLGYVFSTWHAERPRAYLRGRVDFTGRP